MIGVLPFPWKKIQYVEEPADDPHRLAIIRFRALLRGKTMANRAIVPIDSIERRILWIRGEKVMLDRIWPRCMA